MEEFVASSTILFAELRGAVKGGWKFNVPEEASELLPEHISSHEAVIMSDRS